MRKYQTSVVMLFFIVSGLCLVSACKKASSPPITCVSPMSDSAVIGQVLNFTSCTQGATSYLWNFGDGSSATTASATHSYSASGSYTVTFIPYSSAGAGTTKTFTIIVTTSQSTGGSWTFKGVTYNTTSCFGSSGVLAATNATSTNTSTYGSIVANFFSSLPTANGTYIVGANGAAAASNQVGFSLTIDGSNPITYTSTGGNGSNQFVTVSVSGGKVSISGSGVELVNVNNPSDSAAVSLNITQTQ